MTAYVYQLHLQLKGGVRTYAPSHGLFQVTGKLFRPLCCSVLVWLSVGLGPVIFAHYLGISQVSNMYLA